MTGQYYFKMHKITLNDLLSRVNLKTPLLRVAQEVTKSYKLGEVEAMDPMEVGYEELNNLLTTSQGKYVVKIFSKHKDKSTINSNVTAISNFYEGGIPVPKLYKNFQGHYLYELETSPGTYLIVMDYFDGQKFTEIPPTTEDIQNMTKFLARIHTLSFPTHTNYDMWLTINLPQEFTNKKRYLSLDDLALTQRIVDKLARIDFSQLSKSIVHFDLHRENAMKNKRGKYCILDLASCDYNYTVFDLGTFIALFCLDPINNPSASRLIYKSVIETYLKSRSLSKYELSVLPTIIKATYASNLLIPTFLQKTNQDENPQQTIYYQSLGQKGLQILQSKKI